MFTDYIWQDKIKPGMLIFEHQTVNGNQMLWVGNWRNILPHKQYDWSNKQSMERVKPHVQWDWSNGETSGKRAMSLVQQGIDQEVRPHEQYLRSKQKSMEKRLTTQTTWLVQQAINQVICLDLKTNAQFKSQPRQTYVFKAAHEVVADWWSWKVSRVRAPTDVEEIVWAQHGIVLLCVTSGGQNAIHWYGHLLLGMAH